MKKASFQFLNVLVIQNIIPKKHQVHWWCNKALRTLGSCSFLSAGLCLQNSNAYHGTSSPWKFTVSERWFSSVFYNYLFFFWKMLPSTSQCQVSLVYIYHICYAGKAKVIHMFSFCSWLLPVIRNLFIRQSWPSALLRSCRTSQSLLFEFYQKARGSSWVVWFLNFTSKWIY